MTDNIPDDLKFEDVARRMTVDGDTAVVRRQQDISDHFWEQVRNVKHVQDHAPIGDFHQVASIPCVVVEKWMAEGFNMFDPNVTIQDVLKRLRAEDATDLITTSRTI